MRLFATASLIALTSVVKRQSGRELVAGATSGAPAGSPARTLVTSIVAEVTRPSAS